MGSAQGKEIEVRTPARKRIAKAEGWSTDPSEGGSRNAAPGGGDKVTDRHLGNPIGLAFLRWRGASSNKGLLL